MNKYFYFIIPFFCIGFIGCMSFTKEISDTEKYSGIIGRNVSLSKEKCLYWAEEGESIYKEYRLESAFIENLKICQNPNSYKGFYVPIEVIQAGSSIKIIEALRHKDVHGYFWDYVIGSVYSEKLKKEVEFEYFLGFSDSPDPMPWTLEKPN